MAVIAITPRPNAQTLNAISKVFVFMVVVNWLHSKYKIPYPGKKILLNLFENLFLVLIDDCDVSSIPISRHGGTDGGDHLVAVQIQPLIDLVG